MPTKWICHVVRAWRRLDADGSPCDLFQVEFAYAFDGLRTRRGRRQVTARVACRPRKHTKIGTAQSRLSGFSGPRIATGRMSTTWGDAGSDARAGPPAARSHSPTPRSRPSRRARRNVSAASSSLALWCRQERNSPPTRAVTFFCLPLFRRSFKISPIRFPAVFCRAMTSYNSPFAPDPN